MFISVQRSLIRSTSNSKIYSKIDFNAMALNIHKLSARQIPTLGTGFHSDGGGLYLRVKKIRVHEHGYSGSPCTEKHVK